MRVKVCIYEEGCLISPTPYPAREGHRFCCGGRFVKHGSVRYGKAGQIPHNRLKSKHSLKSALTNLWLIGRISGVPGGILQNIAKYNGGRDSAVVTDSNIRTLHRILGCEFSQPFNSRDLRDSMWKQVNQLLAHNDIFRNYFPYQRIEGWLAQFGKHLCDLSLIWSNMAIYKVLAD